MSIKIYINPKLYISSVPELACRLGREIWEAGQGGVTEIITPINLGILTELNHEGLFRTDKPFCKRSLADRNIPLNPYNNWYLCESQMQAEDLTAYMKSQWTDRHEAERLRYLADCDDWLC